MATDNTVAMVRSNILAPSATAVNEVCVAQSDETRFVPEVMYTEKNEYGRIVVKKADPALPSDMLHVQLPAGAPRHGDAQKLKRAANVFPTENRDAVTQVGGCCGSECVEHVFPFPLSAYCPLCCFTSIG